MQTQKRFDNLHQHLTGLLTRRPFSSIVAAIYPRRDIAMTEPQFQPQPPQVSPAEFQQQQLALALAQLMRRVRSGAHTFYWIAALSLVNSGIALFGGTTSFVIGLGLTQWIDLFLKIFTEGLPEIAMPIRVIAIGLDLAIMGLFALFGYMAAKGRKWAFIAGMVLYGLDALLFLPVKDWWSIGFHAYMLWGLYGGLNALNQIQALSPQAGADAAFPQDIGV
jgi:hypothetical protein